MRVQGQLEKAQLENSATDPTPASTGQVYIDTSVTPAVPKYYDGSAWKSFKVGQSSGLYDNGTTSGKTATINWANGLSQKIKLGSNVCLAFSNPVAGEVHTLVVVQRVSDTAASAGLYVYNFNMSDQDSERKPYQTVGVLPSSGSKTHRWLYSASILPAKATVPSNQNIAPQVTFVGALFGGGYSPDGRFFFAGNADAPYGHVVEFLENGGIPRYNEIDPDYENDISTTNWLATMNSMVIHPGGRHVFGASSTSPYVQGRSFDANGIVGISAAMSAATAAAAARKVSALDPSGKYVVVGGGSSPFMEGYLFTNVLTKLTNPAGAQIPAGTVGGLAFSHQGDYLAVLSGTTPYLQVMPVTDGQTTIWGTYASNPASLPGAGPATLGGHGVSWRPQGDWIACALAGGDNLYVIPFDRTTGTFGSASTMGAGKPSGNGNACAWSPCGNFLAVAGTATPYLNIYAYSASTGIDSSAVLTFDGSNPGGQCNDVVWSPNGEWITVCMNVAPYILTYAAPRALKNYIRLID